MTDETDKMVDIEIELTDDEFLYVAKMAHEHGLTFNDMVVKILEDHIARLEK